MGLRLHPYNPDKDLKQAVINARWRLVREHNAHCMEGLPPTDEEIEAAARRKELRRRWYYERGGKEIAKKNRLDRQARLKREGKL